MKPILFSCLITCLWCGTILAQDMPCAGTWEWVSTEYANGDVENPATVGYREELYFGTIDDNRFIRYRNEEPIEEGPYYWSSVFVGPCCIEFVGTDFGDNWTWFTWWDMGVTWLRLQDGYDCPPDVGSPPSIVATYIQRGPVAAHEDSWGNIKAWFR